MAGNQAQVKYMGEMIVSYLPLSHIAAQILDIFVPICYAGTVYFAQPDALKVRREKDLCWIKKYLLV